MGDMVGRKWGIICACAIFSLGIGLQLDTSWAAFVIGRGASPTLSLRHLVTYSHPLVVIAGLGVVSASIPIRV